MLYRAIFFCVLLIFPTPAYAETLPSFSLSPTSSQSWIILSMHPNTHTKDFVRLSNHSSHTLFMHLYPVDAVSGDNGTFTLLLFSQQQKSIGAWSHISTPYLSLPPYSQRVIPFTIDLPSSISPGRYAGGIVAEDNSPSSSSSLFHIIPRVGVRIYLTVPGKTRDIVSFTSFMHTRQALVLTFQNKGTIPATPRVTLSLFGLCSQRVPDIRIPSILPLSTTQIHVPFRPTLCVGYITSSVSYHHTTQSKNLFLFLISPSTLDGIEAITALWVIALCILLYLWKKKKT